MNSPKNLNNGFKSSLKISRVFAPQQNKQTATKPKKIIWSDNTPKVIKEDPTIYGIKANLLYEWISRKDKVIIIDLREETDYEQCYLTFPAHLNLPAYKIGHQKLTDHSITSLIDKYWHVRVFETRFDADCIILLGYCGKVEIELKDESPHMAVALALTRYSSRDFSGKICFLLGGFLDLADQYVSLLNTPLRTTPGFSISRYEGITIRELPKIYLIGKTEGFVEDKKMILSEEARQKYSNYISDSKNGNIDSPMEITKKPYSFLRNPFLKKSTSKESNISRQNSENAISNESSLEKSKDVSKNTSISSPMESVGLSDNSDVLNSGKEKQNRKKNHSRTSSSSSVNIGKELKTTVNTVNGETMKAGKDDKSSVKPEIKDKDVAKLEEKSIVKSESENKSSKKTKGVEKTVVKNGICDKTVSKAEKDSKNILKEGSEDKVLTKLGKEEKSVTKQGNNVKEKTKKCPRGLKNIGNTCFMNAVIHSLNSVHRLTRYFITEQYKKDINKSNKLGYGGEAARIYCELLMGINSSDIGDTSAMRDFTAKSSSSYSRGEQHDAHEFLNFLLDALHEDVNKAKGKTDSKDTTQNHKLSITTKMSEEEVWREHLNKNQSIISDCFHGLLRSTVKCQTCSEESVTFDVFMFLAMPVPDKPNCTLQDCLEEFCRVEEMTGIFCDNCRTTRVVHKQVVIRRFPPHLIIFFMRFLCTNGKCRRLDHLVSFPLAHFDVSKFLLDSSGVPHYSLHGVVNHVGSVNSGHYMCDVIRDGQWYCFDDLDVRRLDAPSITKSAYILFYECAAVPNLEF